MDQIIQLHLDFYEQLEYDVLNELERANIRIVDGFLKHPELVRQYYTRMYSADRRRIVFCGSNPGRMGAGKTGIPFIDFKGANQLLKTVHLHDSEQSAQFILSVIEEIGVKDYHDTVYMTYLSWYGFTKDNRNMNYFDLPASLQKKFTESFFTEMEIVQPKMIVPLSAKVEQTLKQMVADGELNYPIGDRLPHPYFCSIGKNTESTRKRYVDFINRHKAELLKYT